MKFITNLEWKKIRNIILIVLIILLSGYIVIRSIMFNSEYNDRKKMKENPVEETDKVFVRRSK